MGRIIQAFLAAFLFSIIPPAYAQSGAWTISELAGRVTVADGSRVLAAQRGTVIAPGATLSTGAGSRAVVVRGRDFMTVAPNSRVRVPATAEKRGLFEVIQEWGNAVFQIEKQVAPHFGVKTPYLAAVVKGTTFSITVTQEGASLQVVEGAVETSTIDGGAVDLIRPGIVASVTSGDPMRLTVQGQETRQIDSPQRVAPGGAARQPGKTSDSTSDTGTPSSASIDVETASDTSTAASADSAGTFGSQTIAAPVAAKPVDLGKATDGLVTGNGAVQLASRDAASARSDAGASDGGSESRSNGNSATDSAAGSGSSGSDDSQGHTNSGSNGGGVGGSAESSGNSASNGAGGDRGNTGADTSANAGSTGDGNDQGSAGSNDNANANGGAGSTGSGNDQSSAGPNDNANANGGAGSTGSGNDQGSAGPNDNANANGGAGSTGSGNDQSSAGPNDNANANGSAGSIGNGNDQGSAGSNGNGNANGNGNR